jgi:hypothetical protein
MSLQPTRRAWHSQAAVPLVGRLPGSRRRSRHLAARHVPAVAADASGGQAGKSGEQERGAGGGESHLSCKRTKFCFNQV